MYIYYIIYYQDLLYLNIYTCKVLETEIELCEHKKLCKKWNRSLNNHLKKCHLNLEKCLVFNIMIAN